MFVTWSPSSTACAPRAGVTHDRSLATNCFDFNVAGAFDKCKYSYLPRVSPIAPVSANSSGATRTTLMPVTRTIALGGVRSNGASRSYRALTALLTFCTGPAVCSQGK